jgi:proteasome lid subunit RPN8/RPN11
MTKIICPSAVIGETLDHLRVGGTRGNETLVLWLGEADDERGMVTSAHLPEQEVAKDYFRVPPHSMRLLMRHLAERGLKILAQVHSHPFEAFHSRADDHWAIVRHVGALSLVVPNFARETTTANFLREAKTYRLSVDDEWQYVASDLMPSVLEIT